MLNYTYAVLESQVRIAIAEVGLDPGIGYLHACQAGRDSLVYDLMEPHRPKADQKVLALVEAEVFAPRDFVIDNKGVCRLHPELARRVSTLTYGHAATDFVRLTAGLLVPTRGADSIGAVSCGPEAHQREESR